VAFLKSRSPPLAGFFTSAINAAGSGGAQSADDQGISDVGNL
jgi:hypothetical protein